MPIAERLFFSAIMITVLYVQWLQFLPWYSTWMRKKEFPGHRGILLFYRLLLAWLTFWSALMFVEIWFLGATAVDR